jgi:hypothetical protein
LPRLQGGQIGVKTLVGSAMLQLRHLCVHLREKSSSLQTCQHLLSPAAASVVVRTAPAMRRELAVVDGDDEGHGKQSERLHARGTHSYEHLPRRPATEVLA